MKYWCGLTAFIIAAVMFSSNPVQAQKKLKDEFDFHNVVSTYPQALFIGSLRMGYERAVSRKASLAFIGGFGTGEESVLFGVDDFTEFHIELQPRFYALSNTNVLDGGYIGPYFLYKQMNFSQSSFSGTYQTHATSAQVGYLIGFQRIFTSRLTMNIYAGGGMSFASGEHNDVELSYRNGIVAHIGGSLGYAF